MLLLGPARPSDQSANQSPDDALPAGPHQCGARLFLAAVQGPVFFNQGSMQEQRIPLPLR